MRGVVVSEIAPGVRRLTILSAVSIHVYLIDAASATATSTIAAARLSSEPRSIAIRTRSRVQREMAGRTTSIGI
jgi:hypothetical protein